MKLETKGRFKIIAFESGLVAEVKDDGTVRINRESVIKDDEFAAIASIRHGHKG